MNFASYSWAALMIAGVLVCGCGDRAAVAERTPGALRLYIWEEYIADSVVEDFTERTGIEVQITTYSGLDELNRMVRNQTDQIDIAVVDNSLIQQFNNLRLLHELDRDKLPNLANIDPNYLDTEYDPGNRYSVPYNMGTTVLAYRRDKVAEPPDSWSALWDERYRGHIYMFDAEESFHIAALYLGLRANTIEEGDLERVREALLRQRPLVGAYADFDKALEDLHEGTCWVTPMYSGDALLAAEENEQIGLVMPKEGSIVWVDHLVISRDAPNPEAAHLFMNYLLEPKVAGANSSQIWYANPNTKSRAFTDPELLENTIAYPSEEILAKCVYPQPLDAMRIKFFNETWAEIRTLQGATAVENE